MTTGGPRRRRLLSLAVGWRLPVVAAGLAAAVIAQPLLPRLLFLPDLSAGEPIATPVVVIGAWIVAVLALTTAQEPAPVLLASAPSRAAVVNVGRVVLVLAVGVTLLVSMQGAGLITALAAGSTLTGEGLLAASLVGLRSAWLLPTVHLLAAITVGGVNRTEGVAPWAWIIDADAGPWSFSVLTSGVLLAVGCVRWYAALRRPDADS